MGDAGSLDQPLHVGNLRGDGGGGGAEGNEAEVGGAFEGVSLDWLWLGARHCYRGPIDGLFEAAFVTIEMLISPCKPRRDGDGAKIIFVLKIRRGQ